MMLTRSCVSPPPMYTTSGFDWQTASEPIDEVSILPSVIGVQFEPPSVVFHAPPPVAPNQYSRGRASLPPAASDRPPRAGPTLRHRMPLYRDGSTVVPCCADTVGTAIKAATARVNLMNFMQDILRCPRTLATEARRTRRLYFGFQGS